MHSTLIRFCFVAGVAVQVVLNIGCHSTFQLRVKFEQGEPRRNSSVFIDGAVAGYIDAIERATDSVIATVVIKEGDLVPKLCEGVMPSLRKDGGIDLDTSHVAQGARPLESGATISAVGVLGFISGPDGFFREVCPIVIGSLLMIMTVRVFQFLMRLVAVVVPLVIALAIASFYGNLLIPLVKPASDWAVSQLEAQARAKKASNPPQVTPSSAPQVQLPPVSSTHSVTAAPASPSSALDSVDAILVKLARPDPRIAGFFLAWLAVFITLEITFYLAFPVLRRKG